MSGYIKLHRKILDWEWYSDTNTTRTFVHLLITACFKDAKYKGRTVKRGCLITTTSRLSEEIGLSYKATRTALEHLKETGEISILRAGNESLITVKNYSSYQTRDKETISNEEVTNKLHLQKQRANQEQGSNDCGDRVCEGFNNGEGQAKGQTKGNQRANQGQTHRIRREECKEDNTPYIPQEGKCESRGTSHDEIISHLNEKAGTRFKASTKATQRHINARLNESFTPDDFITVIDSRCAKWLGDPEMEQYLRPSTLFGSKFEGYLAYARKSKLSKYEQKRRVYKGTDSNGLEIWEDE